MKALPTEQAGSEPDVSGVLARCQDCRKVHEAETWELDGVIWELHFPMRCTHCGEPNELISLLPISVSLSHDGDEWYVIVLDDEAIARMHLRRDPWRLDEDLN